jgi:hypothetical protein
MQGRQRSSEPQRSPSPQPTSQALPRSRPFSDGPEIADQSQTDHQPEKGHDFGQIPLYAAGVQAKLTVGEPNDQYEQEADRVADQVVNMPAPGEGQSIQRQNDDELQMKPLVNTITPLLQRETLSDDEDLQRKPSLQRDAEGAMQTSEDLESRLDQGGGTPLNDDMRSFMEPRFGADFSQVRVHTDNQAVQMSQELGAQAFTHGSNIYFGAGKYDPSSQSGQHLLAHELTHVVQQTGNTKSPQAKLTASTPKDASEQEADRMADRVMAGESAQVTQSSGANLHGNWLTDGLSAVGDAIGGAVDTVGDAVGDAFDARDNEAELDEWEDYQEAREDLAEFLADSPYTSEDFQPSSGLGMFDATYFASTGTLDIVCKCSFNFIDGSATEFPTAAAADLTWSDAAKEDWKRRYLATVSSSWSGGNHTFHCQNDWWESLQASTSVRFIEVDSGEHFGIDVTKIPSGAFRQSSVGAPRLGGLISGHGDFDSEDLTPTNKPGGTQVGAVHEAGHMLGLDDEYGTGTPSHSDLVEKEFGHAVTRGADGRIMSGGMDILPEHGVTFLEALKDATDMDEWSTAQKSPRDIPSDPSLHNVGDFPTPDSDNVPV